MPNRNNVISTVGATKSKANTVQAHKASTTATKAHKAETANITSKLSKPQRKDKCIYNNATAKANMTGSKVQQTHTASAKASKASTTNDKTNTTSTCKTSIKLNTSCDKNNITSNTSKLSKPQRQDNKSSATNAKTSKVGIAHDKASTKATVSHTKSSKTNGKASTIGAKANHTNIKTNKDNIKISTANTKSSRRKTKASIGSTNASTANAETSMGKLAKSQDIIAMFEQLRISNPQPDTELHYANHFTLLVAIILSAQSTDAQVNKVTKQLFVSVQTPEDIIAMGLDRLKVAINSLGLYNAKANNILHLAEILVQQYHSQVPTDRDTLKTLPGVGQKTANVFLNVAYHQPFIGVDTHVARLSYRLGLLDKPLSNTAMIEAALLQVIPPQYHAYVNHWLVLHGRYICKAKQPQCSHCPLAKYCPQNGVTDPK